MADETLDIYETGDLERPAIPLRSRLYSLRPVGLGTLEVESLTSYLMRLADAHCVTPIKLIEAEFVPVLGKQTRTVIGRFSTETHNLNGTSAWAGLTITALEHLTLRDDVRFLSMYPWRHGLARHRLVRHHLAWCPACYQEWRQSGQVVYNPLVWALDVVRICPRHRQALRQCCPHADCRKRLSHFSCKGKLGHCPYCKRWLGIESPADGIPDESELHWQAWITARLGEMFAAVPHSFAPPQQWTVGRNIEARVEAAAPKSVREVAREVGLSPAALTHWMKGGRPPCLDLLARLCHCLDVPLLDIFAPQPGSEAPPEEICLGEANHRRRPTQVVETDQLRRRLEHLLKDAPSSPRSPGQMAQQLGVGVDCLAHHCPDQYQQIVEQYDRYRQAQRAMRNEKLERDLQACLESDDLPPPSLQEVARRLKIGPVTARQICPELCRSISRKHVAYFEARHKRAGAGLKEILAANEDPPPPMPEVARRLGEDYNYLYRNYPELCRTVTGRFQAYQRTKGGRQPAKPARSPLSRRKDGRRIRRQFAAILAAEEKPPPSIMEVGRRLECSPAYLRRRCPDLHAQLGQQAEAYHWAQTAEANAKLREILAQHEIPPPSMREVAIRLGREAPTLKRQCPELCEEITHRYRSHRRTAKGRRKAFLGEVVSKNESPPPSLPQVARSLNCRAAVLRCQFPEESRVITQRHQAYSQAQAHMQREVLEAILTGPAPAPLLTQVARQLGYENSKHLCHQFPELCRRIIQRRQANRQQIAQSVLETSLAENAAAPPPTLEALSCRLGYSCSSLKRLFPDQCRAIMDRQQAYQHERRLAVEHALKAILADEENPPVSVRAVAARCGLASDTIRDCFPELAAAVTEKYKAYVKERGQQRRRQLDEEVKRVARELHRQGIRPSLRQVALRLPSPKAIMEPHVRQAWREALSELGL